MLKWIVSCGFLAALPAAAALPPLYQSINEYKALVEDPRLAKALSSSGPILSIERKEGAFMVRTPTAELFVQITYETQKQPGPAAFRLDFAPLEPLSTEHKEGLQ